MHFYLKTKDLVRFIESFQIPFGATPTDFNVSAFRGLSSSHAKRKKECKFRLYCPLLELNQSKIKPNAYITSYEHTW